MSKELSQIAQQLLEIAKSAGADAADVLVVDGTSVSVEARAGAMEMAERAEGVDIGLRVIQGDRQACVSASDTSKPVMEELASRAIAMANLAPSDPYCGLAEPSQLAKSWDADVLQLKDDAPEPSPEAMLERAIKAEAAAMEVKGVNQVQTASAAFSAVNIHLASSNGFAGGYGRSTHSTACVAIAGEGVQMERDYCGEARSFLAQLPDADEIGQLAGQRATERFGAKRPPTGQFPILFDERISASLIGHVVGAMNGASIARGASWLKDALGEQVLPSGFDLVEDPSRPFVSGSKPFDAEGLPVAKRHLIKDGVIMGWTLDLATARQLNMESTASASRGVSSPPSPSVGNLELTQGTKSRADLIADMGTGLIVTSMIGSTINPTTGDYSRGASGLWVENGKIIGPVNECTIAGNLRDFMGRIVAANDAQTHLSRLVPSLLIEGLTIAGS